MSHESSPSENAANAAVAAGPARAVKLPSLMNQRPAALLFDMDGTITEPMLDFPKIKAEMGIGERPILEALAGMSEQERRAAEAILLRHEERAAVESSLNPGCREVMAWVRENRVPTALITRNSRASVNVVLAKHGLTFDLVISREHGKFKPDPEPLVVACERLAVQRPSAWMIGDGQHDVDAGRAAGVPVVWVSHARQRDPEAGAWKTVRDLWELVEMLRSTQG
jgi:HAD superfamily hydrolase (TIGR01509 family)